jgi:hypothetical protein
MDNKLDSALEVDYVYTLGTSTSEQMLAPLSIGLDRSTIYFENEPVIPIVPMVKSRPETQETSCPSRAASRSSGTIVMSQSDQLRYDESSSCLAVSQILDTMLCPRSSPAASLQDKACIKTTIARDYHNVRGPTDQYGDVLGSRELAWITADRPCQMRNIPAGPANLHCTDRDALPIYPNQHSGAIGPARDWADLRPSGQPATSDNHQISSFQDYQPAVNEQNQKFSQILGIGQKQGQKADAIRQYKEALRWHHSIPLLIQSIAEGRSTWTGSELADFDWYGPQVNSN